MVHEWTFKGRELSHIREVDIVCEFSTALIPPPARAKYVHGSAGTPWSVGPPLLVWPCRRGRESCGEGAEIQTIVWDFSSSFVIVLAKKMHFSRELLQISKFVKFLFACEELSWWFNDILHKQSGRFSKAYFTLTISPSLCLSTRGLKENPWRRLRHVFIKVSTHSDSSVASECETANRNKKCSAFIFEQFFSKAQIRFNVSTIISLSKWRWYIRVSLCKKITKIYVLKIKPEQFKIICRSFFLTSFSSSSSINLISLTRLPFIFPRWSLEWIILYNNTPFHSDGPSRSPISSSWNTAD